jgi:hypothetical protein
MAEPPVVYVPRPDATPEAELTALVNIYRTVLKKRGRLLDKSGPDDAKERSSSNDSSASQHCTT